LYVFIIVGIVGALLLITWKALRLNMRQEAD